MLICSFLSVLYVAAISHTKSACWARRAAVPLVHISTATAPAGTFAPPANAIGISVASGICEISALSYTYRMTTLGLRRFVIAGDTIQDLWSVLSKLKKNINKGNGMWFYDHCYKPFYQLRGSTLSCNTYSYVWLIVSQPGNSLKSARFYLLASA